MKKKTPYNVKIVGRFVGYGFANLIRFCKRRLTSVPFENTLFIFTYLSTQ